MDHKTLMLSAIKGEPTDRIPFVPRLDIWYNANKINQTLPARYKNASLTDISDDLGLGFHAVIPAFRDYEDENGDADLGLGIYRFKTVPYNAVLHNVKRQVLRGGGLVSVRYTTPYGDISTKVLYDETMRKSGSTLAHVMEYAIKSVDDLRALAYIFENIEVIPKYEYYLQFRENIGQRGLAICFNSLCASPMHYIMKELISVEDFFYMNFDYPGELDQLAESISRYYDKTFAIAANCPSEVVLSGANYDSAIVTPPIFEKYVVDSLNTQAQTLHAKGKFLLTHTDGENKGLTALYKKSGFDIADSICPSPMTNLTLKDIREEFNGKITIWGGIPSVSVLEETMSDYEFDQYLYTTMESIGNGGHIIFSIADTTPPAAKWERILKIDKIIKGFGPVNPMLW